MKERTNSSAMDISHQLSLSKQADQCWFSLFWSDLKGFCQRGLKRGYTRQKSPILAQIQCKNAIVHSQRSHSKAGKLLCTPSPIWSAVHSSQAQRITSTQVEWLKLLSHSGELRLQHYKQLADFRNSYSCAWENILSYRPGGNRTAYKLTKRWQKTKTKQTTNQKPKVLPRKMSKPIHCNVSQME